VRRCWEAGVRLACNSEVFSVGARTNSAGRSLSSKDSDRDDKIMGQGVTGPEISRPSVHAYAASKG